MCNRQIVNSSGTIVSNPFFDKDATLIYRDGEVYFVSLQELVYAPFGEMEATIRFIGAEDMSKRIKKVIFNNPATIVYWKDGTKTVVKCQEGDKWDKEKGLMACICKKFYGNKGKFNDVIKEWCGE